MYLVSVRVIESPECVDKVQGVWGLKSSCTDTNGVRVSITAITSAPILPRNTCIVKFIRFLDLTIFLNITPFHFSLQLSKMSLCISLMKVTWTAIDCHVIILVTDIITKLKSHVFSDSICKACAHLGVFVH